MGLNEIFAEGQKIQYGFEEVKDKSVNIIKVIGIGGGGGNAVKNMLRRGVENVSFAVVNTDSQALAKTEVPCKLQIGQNGLGVGGRPELGREAAEYSIDNIRKLFDDGTKMVFITAGMGGGTGTGAAPIIANAARENGILTVGVVTLPFAFEKKLRIEKALKGVEELKANVDALLVINNERLMQIYADGLTTISDAFKKADEIVTIATKSIAEIITLEGEVNRDFCDVQTVMKDGGGALMSEGRASGEHRIMKAMAEALNSPLLNNVEVERSQRLLYIIYQSHKSPVLITELNEVNQFMDRMANDLEVLWGLYWDDTLDDDVKVNIIATGFDKERTTNIEGKVAEEREEKLRKLFELHYAATESGTETDSSSASESETSSTFEPSSTSEIESSSPDESALEADLSSSFESESLLHTKQVASPSSPKNSWIRAFIRKAKEIVEEEVD